MWQCHCCSSCRDCCCLLFLWRGLLLLLQCIAADVSLNASERLLRLITLMRKFVAKTDDRWRRSCNCSCTCVACVCRCVCACYPPAFNNTYAKCQIIYLLYVQLAKATQHTHRQAEWVNEWVCEWVSERKREREWVRVKHALNEISLQLIWQSWCTRRCQNVIPEWQCQVGSQSTPPRQISALYSMCVWVCVCECSEPTRN